MKNFVQNQNEDYGTAGIFPEVFCNRITVAETESKIEFWNSIFKKNRLALKKGKKLKNIFKYSILILKQKQNFLGALPLDPNHDSAFDQLGVTTPLDLQAIFFKARVHSKTQSFE